jgi:hypothetical protein
MDSIRLRITPTELEAIERGQPVTASLPAVGWSAQIISSETETRFEAAGPVMTLALSRADAARLAEPEREGVYFQRETEPPLRYYIEKDFPCVHKRPDEAQEPQTETFGEPPGFRERKGVA